MKVIEKNLANAKRAKIIHLLSLGYKPSDFFRITHNNSIQPGAGAATELLLYTLELQKNPNLTNTRSSIGAGIDESVLNSAYELFDPPTGTPFYVGVTKNCRDRLKQHIADALTLAPVIQGETSSAQRTVAAVNDLGPLVYCLTKLGLHSPSNRLRFAMEPSGLRPSIQERKSYKLLSAGVYMQTDCSAARVVDVPRQLWADLDIFWPGWNEEHARAIWYRFSGRRGEKISVDSEELRAACFVAARRARGR